MPAERFFTRCPLHETIHLDGPEFHHLVRVMRIRVGEEVELVDGKGALAKAKLVSIDKHKASLHVISCHCNPVDPPQIILAIPLMRPAKLELVIEKCTELGADAFWIYPAQHSDKEQLSSNQMERLSHICIAAMKQCGRLDLPAIEVLSHFSHLLQTKYPIYFGDTRPNAKRKILQTPLILITGPEKGFSESELKLLDQKAEGTRLHRYILRAETAPIAALCSIEKSGGE